MHDRITLRPPPVLDRTDGGGAWLGALPLLGSLGSIGLVATMSGGRRQYVGIGLFVVGALLVALGQAQRTRRQRSRSRDLARRDYLAHLARAREDVRRAGARRRAEALARHPPPAALAALLECGAWRPGPGLRVRYGAGEAPLEEAPALPEIGSGADPFCVTALRRLAAASATWPGMPATLDLAVTREVLAPPGTARALVCAAAGCRDLTIAVLADPDALPHWSWVKWLPRAVSRAVDDGVGPRRLVAGSMAELDTLLVDSGHLLLVVDGMPAPPTTPTTTLLVVDERLSADGAPLRAVPDECPVEVAEAIARRSGAAASVLRTAPDWSPRSGRAELTVPLGTTEAGHELVLDLKESALGGDGPHGLVIGATGSGKSELLRALVLGLALRHPPERLNLVLVDFKGGTAFDGLAPLPHVAALITNLADEVDLLDRAADALTGELTRRQEVVRAAGGDRGDLPTLLVVVDEFAELLAARPDLDELFVTLGRLGRGLGIHLLLASQRLEDGRWRGLESHVSYRIGLRTFTPEESRAVLGTVDAYELPPTPGLGYLRTDPRTLHRFRAAYAGGVLRRPADPTRVLPFTAAAVAGPPPEAVSVVDAAVSAMRGRGRPAHRIWLPPLTRSATLADLLPGLAVDPVRGFGQFRPTVPLGEVDRPLQQRRDVLDADLTAGSLGVVGASGSGRSTLLHTAVLGLALTRTPAEVVVHVLDLGGRLAPLAGLPHVASVVGRDDPDLAARVLRQLQEGADRPVVLVVDDWTALRQVLPDLEEQVARLAGSGRARGVHLVIAAGRWTDLRASVRDSLVTRIELRLGDPLDSEVDRRLAAAVPRGRPGRGLAAGHHFLGALPRLGDGDPVDLVARHWHGARPVRLRALPTLVRLEELPGHPGVRLGVREGDHGLRLLPGAGHLVVFGDGGSGRTALLRTLVREVARARPADRLLVVDPRGTLAGERAAQRWLAHVTGDPHAAVRAWEPRLRERLIPPAADGDLWLVVDDLDLLPPTAWQPLLPLLPRAADLGLRVVVARRTGGAGRALYEPLLAILQELRTPGVLLSGSPTEGPLVGGVSARSGPPGRGCWVSPGDFEEPFQAAWVEP